MSSFEVTREDLRYLIQREIVVSKCDNEHANKKLREAWAQIEAPKVESMDTFKVSREDLRYLIERELVADKCPDSEHAYKKLQEAWSRIEDRSSSTFPDDQ